MPAAKKFRSESGRRGGEKDCVPPGGSLVGVSFTVALIMLCVLPVAGTSLPDKLQTIIKFAPDAVNAGPLTDVRLGEERLDPWVDRSMPRDMRRKIETAFDIAVERVRNVPDCASLFAPYGANGLDLLRSTLYFRAGPHFQANRCRHAFAVTSVGGNTTWVCRRVMFHTDENVAVALIHEALHFAGLTEYPQDLRGMDSGEINSMVMRNCGL